MLMTVISIVALILTLIAMALSIGQSIVAKRQTNHLKSIHDSLSTRYIGRFPSYLHDILKILETAKKEITIVCDVPSFGAFSDPNSWLEYRHILDKKIAEGVDVSLIVLNKEKRRTIYHEQFGNLKTNWEEWVDASITNLLKKPVFKKFKTEEEVKKISWDTFINLMIEHDDKTLNSYFDGAKNISELSADLAMYFWAVDSDCAVFAIPKFSVSGQTFVTSAFITSDHRLINSLLALKESFYEREVAINSSKGKQ